MPQPKRFTTDGGHRGQTPAETLRRYSRHLSPITGIVSELQPVSFGTGADFVHAYVTDHNFALDYRDLDLVREGLRGRAGGKGKSDQQARASALCESLERYSGVFQGDEARLTARFDDLAGAAIHPNACMNFSQRQYETRIELNARPSRFNRVPEPFDESREIEWSPVWSLTHQVWRYLPTAYCYYGYDQHQSAPYARADANGCAAGNSLEEAILQGFLELVERDSVALWWYNRLPVPGVDLTSFDEPYFSQLVDYYGSQQRALWVLDITADFGIPTFAAVTGRIDQAAEDLLFAFGAHFDPQLALLRALTELNQMLPALFDGTPTGPNWDQDALAWWQTATLENQPYLVPASAQKVRTKEDYAMPVSDDLYTDVQHCIELVKSKGMELLVLDQTRPDVGLPVVKVIVPGMRHFWARFGPGRLYDVPVRLGRLPQPYTEDELNPHWMFL
jgi:ribosomal protein S12 methylthiotransferase accessory factor